MNSRPAKLGKILDCAGVAARWIVGGLFIYMGLNKALHPADFLKLVREYELVSNHYLLNGIAASLPWFEIFCGFLLITGVAVRGAGLVLLLMLIPFTVVVFKRALAIAELQQIAFCAVKFDCGCGNGEVLICRKLLENALLIGASLWLAFGAGRKLSARFYLVGPAEPKEAAPAPSLPAPAA